MIKKAQKVIFITSFIFFIVAISLFYFSEQNIIKVNKFRSSYISNLNELNLNLPIIKNDTNNIILYTDGIEIYKKNKKNYKFWDLIKKYNNE